MALHNFYVVDVFSDQAFRGNPVAVVTDADALDAAQMQSFAAWNGMPETVYLQSNRDQAGATYHARIFSPLAELAFAGHPSLGAAYIAMECGIATAEMQASGSEGFETGQTATLWQHGKAGRIEMKWHASLSGEHCMYVKTPAASSTVALNSADARAVLDSLAGGMEHAVYRVSAGAQWIVLPLPDHQTMASLVPDMPAIKALSIAHQVSGITVYAPAVSSEDARFEVRSFGPAIGVTEDAVCGGGNACVAALDAALNGVGETPHGSRYSTVQGRFVGRAGRVNLLGPVPAGLFWIGGVTKTIMRGTVNF